MKQIKITKDSVLTEEIFEIMVRRASEDSGFIEWAIGNVDMEDLGDTAKGALSNIAEECLARKDFIERVVFSNPAIVNDMDRELYSDKDLGTKLAKFKDVSAAVISRFAEKAWDDRGYVLELIELRPEIMPLLRNLKHYHRDPAIEKAINESFQDKRYVLSAVQKDYTLLNEFKLSKETVKEWLPDLIDNNASTYFYLETEYGDDKELLDKALELIKGDR